MQPIWALVFMTRLASQPMNPPMTNVMIQFMSVLLRPGPGLTSPATAASGQRSLPRSDCPRAPSPPHPAPSGAPRTAKKEHLRRRNAREARLVPISARRRRKAKRQEDVLLKEGLGAPQRLASPLRATGATREDERRSVAGAEAAVRLT